MEGKNELSDKLGNIRFFASCEKEDDGSITLSLDDLDIVVNAKTIETAKERLASDIVEYAKEYRENYLNYSKAPNRIAHIPFVRKALLAESPSELVDFIVCHD